MRSSLLHVRTIVRAAALLAMLAIPAAAQVPLDSVQHGSRVRVKATSAGIPWRTPGVLSRVSGDSVYLRHLERVRLRDSMVAIPLHRVEILDLSVERRDRFERGLKGAGWALLGYAALAGGYLMYERMRCDSRCFDDGFLVLGIVVWSPFVAGAGAMVGFALPVERWRPIRLAPR